MKTTAVGQSWHRCDTWSGFAAGGQDATHHRDWPWRHYTPAIWVLHIPEGWAGTWTAGLSLGAATGKWAISLAGSTQQEWESHSSQSAFTWNADLKCPYFLHNTILSNSSILKKQLVRKENGRSLINTAILIFSETEKYRINLLAEFLSCLLAFYLFHVVVRTLCNLSH